MSIGSDIGVKIEKPKKLRNLIEYFFGEDQGRYILEIEQKNLNKVEKILKMTIFIMKIWALLKKIF